jgi:hypothetical protein
MQHQHRAVQSAVAHQQIAAQTHRIQRLISRQAAQVHQQIIQIGGLIHPLSRTACVPAGVLAHINLTAQRAAQC